MTDVVSGFGVAERERVSALREQATFFWLDVSLSESSLDGVVDGLAIPDRAALALSRSGSGDALRTFHADTESVVFAVRCYVRDTDPGRTPFRFRHVDARVLITGEYLLTLHDEPVPLPRSLAPELREGQGRRQAVYSVLDAMVASTSDALDEIELRLDGVAKAWSSAGSSGLQPRRTLQAPGARLAALRRGVRAEQTLFGRVGTAIGAFDGFDPDPAADFGLLDDEVDRLLSATDAAANAVGMLLDLQLNEDAYVVSVVATIFVPLTFVTGFFGMNFGWLTDHIDSAIAFWLLGFTIPIAVSVVCWRLFVRRFVMADGA